jgi:hypothetical protein
MVKKPNWTVLVYMVADTGDSFYQDAMDDITEMMEARFDDRIKVIVHADAPSPWQTNCWEVTSFAQAQGGNASARKIGEAKEIACDHVSLLDFVQKCVKSYPSENYLLVLWGHGEGIDWKQKVLAGPPNSTVQGVVKRFAPGSQNAIEVGELGKALEGLDLRGLEKDRVVVGFDACLMGMVEVYDEINKYAGWGVAAADEIPDTGWPYTNVLQVLGNCPETPPEELVSQIVKICAQWYSNPDHSPDAKVSFAACDLSRGPAVLKYMNDLTRELRACISDARVRKAVKDARDSAEDLREKAYVDLHAFCSELVQHTERRELRNAANSVVEALSAFVSHRYQFSDSYPQRYSKDARAVSICFPASADLLGSIPDLQVNWGSYIDLTFSRTTHWPCFLTEFWDKQRAEDDRRKPQFLVKAAGC